VALPDVAPAAGRLDPFSMAGGIIVDDFENNGPLGHGQVEALRSCCADAVLPQQWRRNFYQQAAKAGLEDHWAC